MKAAVLERTGGPEVLHLADVPAPTPGDNDLVVRVHAAAVNPVDLKTRSGFLDLLRTTPAVLGWDVSGTVEATGPAVRGPVVGTQVVGMLAQPMHRYGTYAETVVADASLFAPAPGGTDPVDAAALPLAALTARQALDALDPAPGSRVLVTGAAGAVGRIAVQLLLADGHRADALARAADAEDLLGLGALRAGPAELFRPEDAYDAVLDTAGTAAAVDLVRDGGRFLGIDDNEQPAARRGIVPTKSYVEQDGAMLAALSALVTAGRLHVPVARRFALSDAADAHAHVERGGVRGKVLLIP